MQTSTVANIRLQPAQTVWQGARRTVCRNIGASGAGLFLLLLSCLASPGDLSATVILNPTGPTLPVPESRGSKSESAEEPAAQEALPQAPAVDQATPEPPAVETAVPDASPVEAVPEDPEIETVVPEAPSPDQAMPEAAEEADPEVPEAEIAIPETWPAEEIVPETTEAETGVPESPSADETVPEAPEIDTAIPETPPAEEVAPEAPDIETAAPELPAGDETAPADTEIDTAARTAPAPMALPLAPSDIATYKSAFKRTEKNDWKAVRRLAARGNHPLPRKILRWLEMTQPDSDYSFSEIADFIDRNPDWPQPKTLQKRAEEAITETTPSDRILTWFTNRAPRTTEGKIAYGQALIDSGQAEEGFTHIRDAWIFGRFGRRDENRFLRRYRKRFTGEDHWERLDNLLWQGRHSEARRMLKRVSSGYRALAKARMRLRRRRGGVDAAIGRVPASLRGDSGLMYERLRWRRRKGFDLDALEILKNPPADMVRPDLWSRERLILARRLLADGRIADAYRAVRDHGLDHRHPADFAEAEWLTGWIALRFMNQGKEARQRFESLYRAVQYPVSKSRAAYWAGRAAQVLGDESQANLWFQDAARHPTTYHGQLATHSLGQNSYPVPDPVSPSEAEIMQFAGHELAHAVRILKELDQNRYLRTFLLRFSNLNKTPGHRVLAGDLAKTVDRPDLAVWIARYAKLDGDVLLDMGYPLFEIPEGDPERALLLAVARQESNFYPKAISRTGARGIMQLMPRTARLVARTNGIRYSRNRLTSDPEYNVRLGRRYLQDMLSKFNGSYILAVAAYNAGPNAVSRWLDQNGDPRDEVNDPIDWIELIPYQETRTYVQRVLGNLQVFRSRLQPDRMAITLDRDLRR